jgi:glycine cleavage system regulatory protein
MTASLIVTLHGEDRPGVVERLSRVLAEHGANWNESRMTRLANQFSGILLVTVPESRLEQLKAALQNLATVDLAITLKELTRTEPTGARVLTLELLGQDRPGIVHEFAEALAQRGVNINELETRCSSASWSGGTVFRARAELSVPKDQPLDELQRALEALANELMVELSLTDRHLT